jgi:protein-tyrosine phosphatase
MIDLHCHPLPGIDDGPSSMESALEMLRCAADAGTRMMVATPHVSAAYPQTTAERVAAGVRALQAQADAAHTDVLLVAGAEVEILHCEMLAPGDLPGLRLGAGPYTLVELPFSTDARFAEMALAMHGSLAPAVLAHPERCRAFHDDADLLERLVDQGLLVQLTAASIVGAYGSTVQRVAWRMLEQGLVHVVASDAHDARQRPPMLRPPLEEVGLGAFVATLCQDNPAAILAGERPSPVIGIAPPRSLRRNRLRAGLRRR